MLSPAAAKIEVATEPKDCKKLGTAHGIGREIDEKISEQQAIDGAKEAAVKLGGDTIVFVTQTSAAEAGAGGSVTKIGKTVDVYTCTKK